MLLVVIHRLGDYFFFGEKHNPGNPLPEHGSFGRAQGLTTDGFRQQPPRKKKAHDRSPGVARARMVVGIEHGRLDKRGSWLTCGNFNSHEIRMVRGSCEMPGMIGFRSIPFISD